MLDELRDTTVSEARVQAMLRELVRKAVAGMIARQESDVPLAESDAYLGHLSSEKDRIRDAQRARDWKVATPFATEVARQNGLTKAEVEDPAVARQVLALMRQLFQLAQHVEDDAADPLHAGRALLLDHGLAPTRDALKPPMALSAAIEKACEEASPDVAKKIRVVGDLALSYFGDIPLTSLDLAQSFDFLHMVWMLPKGWGKAHGRNRHGQAGRDLCSLAEIREADRKDAALVADILAQEDLSVPEKRRRLVTELTPRLVDSYLIVQRDMFNRIVKAALGAKRVGRDIDDEDRIVPSHAQLQRRMQNWHNVQKTDCGLPTRVSHPKRRRSWSLEHIARLLNSPVYTGTSSKAQRWRPAKASKRHVIRDALYWVPLFMISLGVRPEEILQLKINNVRRRDGLICLFFGDDADERLKSEESRRILPVPQLLLDLGFREWVIQRRRSGEIWAFPEIAPSEADQRRSQIFGGRMRTLLRRLKLNFSDEDIYAMRRTLSSKLLHLKVDRGVRQRILGHLEGTTIDRHYSDDGLQDLKDVLDRVDYGIQIGRIPRIEFPVVAGCNTPFLPSLDVDVRLTDQGELAAIELLDADTDETVLAARIEGVAGSKICASQEHPIRPAKDVAEAIVALQASHTLTLPADDAVVAAIEHLLILAESPNSRQPDVALIAGSVSDTVGIEIAPLSDQTLQAPLMHQPHALNEAAGGLQPGDTAVCVFPLARRGNSDGQPRPGLVVGVKIMHGQRYLDIAQGSPADAGPVAAHQIVVADQVGLASARLTKPTCFNLRRRILVAEIDTDRIQGRLGNLSDKSRKRLREMLGFVGDISPDPLSDRTRVRSGTFAVERRSEKAGKMPRRSVR